MDKIRKTTRRWMPSSEIRYCTRCGNSFNPKKYGGERQRFCSDRCRAQWNAEQYTIRRGRDVVTEMHKRKKWGGAWWAAAERDQFTCVICGAKPKTPHLHHIDGTGNTDSPNYDLSNLVTLCTRCHTTVHSKISFRIQDGFLWLEGLAIRLIGWGEKVRIPVASVESVK